MRRLWWLLSLLIFTSHLTSAQAVDPAINWNPPVFDAATLHLGSVGAVACDPINRKLYVGQVYCPDRTRDLLVFDMAADGSISGKPRGYAVVPGPLPYPKRDSINCLLLDSKHRKLYIGVGSEQEGMTTTLAMLSLDAKGEPTGAPEAFPSGNPNHVVQALALHPKLNRLYAVGWGGAGVYATDLDEGGRPAKAPVALPVGGQGKASIAFRSDGTKLYLGTYPDVLEICDLDARGAIARSASKSLKIGLNGYLTMSANDRGIYFRDKDGLLNYFRLDAQGNPQGEAVKDARLPIQAANALGNDKLVIAESSTFKDAITGKPCVDGVRMRVLALQADGAPGLAMKTSKAIPRQQALAMCSAPGVSLLTSHVGWGFQGNRFAGLMLRATLVSAAVDGLLPPAKDTLSFQDNGSTYLNFVYSPARDEAYMIFGEMILACSGRPRNGEMTKKAVRCPNLGSAMTVDDANTALYTALKDGSLKRFALAADGTPSDTEKTVQTGMNPVAAIRINPKTGQFYIFGNRVGEQQAGTAGKLVQVTAPGYLTDVAVDAARGRLYGTSSYNGNTNIWIWKLNADGTLAKEPPRAIADGLTSVTNPGLRSLMGNIRIDVKRNRLYTGGHLENSPQAAIVVYTLNAAGDPQGGPRLYKTPHKAGVVEGVGLSNDGRWLYHSGWGDDVLYAYPLNAAGDPPDDVAKVEKWPVGGAYAHYSITPSADGKRLMMGTWPSLFESIPLQVDGRPIGGLACAFAAGTQKYNLGFLPVGASSPWITLDTALKDGAGVLQGGLSLAGASIKSVVVKLDFARKEAPNALLLSHNSTLAGGSLAVFLPRYGIDDTAKVASLIQPSDLRYKQYLSWATQYALKPEERPKQLIVANGMIPIDSCVESLKYGLQTLGVLGHNTAQIWAGMPPALIYKDALESGITRTRFAVYNPQTYFDYVPELMTPDSQDKWAKEFRKPVEAMGFAPETTALFHMADEPGWYFPSQYDAVKNSPAALTVFRDYLKGKGMTPELLGKAGWEQVEPMRPSKVQTLGDKRLFFWTTRFYTESLSKAFAAATAAMQRQVNPNILTTTNLNNWPGRYYIASPGAKIANNGDAGPDAGMGMPDWFDLGRKKAVTAIWTEDWFGDGAAGNWSLYTDLMRCAAREGGVEYGGYTVGHSTGAMENGGKYKIMALMGHGAKALDPYTFGPNPGFGDGWSDNGPRVYQSLSSGLRLLGRSERLVAPGRPRSGSVAILFSQASQAWDSNSGWNMYLGEYYGLHSGLIHRQYPVDFIDDFDVEDGALQKYGYSTLYLGGPNLSVRAQEAIMAWVKAGGTLVLLPGACTADQYNEPTPQMATFAGAGWTGFTRVPGPTADELRTITPKAIKVLDGRFGADGDQTVYQALPLALAGAKALAEYGDGGAAIAEITQGAGRVLTYGFWPGADYGNNGTFAWAPADEDRRALSLLAGPAKIAGARKFVDISEDRVEGALLESEKGIAVTLLNWTRGQAPLKSITVTVASSPGLDAAVKSGKLKVESAELGALKFQPTARGVQVTLPLKDVDVLLLTF